MPLAWGNPRRLWTRYLIAVSFILVLVTGSHVAALQASSSSDQLAESINLSGRQRLLSQQILYFAGQLASGHRDQATTSALADAIELFERSHVYLTRGRNLGPALREIYFDEARGKGLDAAVQQFIGDAKTILDGPPHQIGAAWRRMTEVGPDALLTSLDAAVHGFENEAKSNVEAIRDISNIGFFLALLLLLGEIVFIFWPAHRSIVVALDDLEDTAAKLRRSEGEARALLTAATEARREAEVARDEAKVASRVKSEFIATMSHEIRTPMNGVLGMASALLGGKLSREQRDQVQVIKDSGESLLELLNDILDLSKIEAGRFMLEPSDFSLGQLLGSVDALWASRAQAKGLAFKMDLEPSVADAIHADKKRLRQVLVNLISNAVKFTTEGEVRVSLSAIRAQSGVLLFKVSDSGIGISEAYRAKLFDPFQQGDTSTTRRYGGTGLGLAISKHLVEMMGGELGVESEPGHGSTFWFTIAAEPASSEGLLKGGEDETLDVALPQVGRTLRILAAEDNHINQLVLRSVLKPLNCTIDIVVNGVEAVAAAQAERYDLVLMDVQMPEMDGLTATRRIRALSGEAARVPIIALTANAMKGDRERYLAGGMNDYVAKPVNPQELFGAILRCCDNAPRDAAVALLEDARPEPAAGPVPSAKGQAALSDILGSIDAMAPGKRDAG